MAERTATRDESVHSILITWSGLLNGDTGNWYELPAHGDRTFQVEGTFGTGGTVVMQGSNDGVNAHTMTDPQANALSKTAAAMELIQERPRYIRPNITAGDGATNLVVTVYCGRTNR